MLQILKTSTSNYLAGCIPGYSGTGAQMQVALHMIIPRLRSTF